jgi:ferredoxin
MMTMTRTLRTSKDRKVANVVTKNGKQAAISNTMGLANGKAYSCVGATEYCETICYAGKLENLFKPVGAMMLANYEALKDATLADMVYMLDGIVTKFIAESKRHGAEMIYRIHWDGDFFSVNYIDAWIAIIREYHMVQFWVYTRNVQAAQYLKSANLPNLSLYFSADKDNEGWARWLYNEYGIRTAAVAETFADSQDMVKRITGRVGAKCPEQTGQIPLISAEGSACARCRLCVDNKANISFSRSGK